MKWKSLGLLCVGALAGAVISGVLTYAFAGRQVSGLLALNQDIQVSEWQRLAQAAYAKESPDVAIWAVSNFLAKLDDTFSSRPAKGRDYYFLKFEGQARLVALYGAIHDTRSESNALEAAKMSLNHWSTNTQPDKKAVLNALRRIDASDPGR